MDIDKNLIRHWANLFESEEARTDDDTSFLDESGEGWDDDLDDATRDTLQRWDSGAEQFQKSLQDVAAKLKRMPDYQIELLLWTLATAVDPDKLADSIKSRTAVHRYPEMKKALVALQRAFQMRKEMSDVVDKGADWPEHDPEVYESRKDDAPEDEPCGDGK